MGKIKPSRKTLINKLDKIWREDGKDKAYCEICDTLPLKDRVDYTRLHPHHIIPRGHKATRWEPMNKIWLCSYHHVMGMDSAHKSPIWFAEWLKKYKPETYKWTLKHMNDVRHFTLSELDNLDMTK